MAEPITTDDLYGASGSEKSKEVPFAIPVEETPEITAEVKQETPPKKRPGCLGLITKIVLFVGFIVGGVWLSSNVRQFTTQKDRQDTPTPTVVRSLLVASPSAVPVNTWKTYDVISGTTKTSFGGVTFKLPPDVLSPICDGTSCGSQGTYLPGGTRFTVAARGSGQTLADFRGTAIADTRGTTFTTKQTSVAGFPALEFSGSFAGGTVSGYSFTSMRGIMISLTSTTSLEINHFTPNGIVADFVSDDALFDEVLKTVIVSP